MRRIHLVVVLGMVLISGPVWADEGISKVNGHISADAGRQYGDLETVNGGVSVGDRTRTGDVESVNGGIEIGARASTGGISTVNGGVTVGAGTVVSGDIETVNGSVLVERGSQVSGGVETVNGSIGLIGTQLGKGIETVNGDITVGVDSHVGGDIRIEKSTFGFWSKPSRKPRVVIGPRAVVDGSLRFEREVALYVHRSARIGAVSGATPRPFDSDVAPQD